MNKPFAYDSYIQYHLNLDDTVLNIVCKFGYNPYSLGNRINDSTKST